MGEMSTPTRPMWIARGVVAAPRDAVWRALLAATPQLRGQDVARLSAGHEVHRLVVSLGDPLAGTARVEVDSTACRFRMQHQRLIEGLGAMLGCRSYLLVD
jgi:hypothetical protein